MGELWPFLKYQIHCIALLKMHDYWWFVFFKIGRYFGQNIKSRHNYWQGAYTTIPNIEILFSCGMLKQNNVLQNHQVHNIRFERRLTKHNNKFNSEESKHQKFHWRINFSKRRLCFGKNSVFSFKYDKEEILNI